MVSHIVLICLYLRCKIVCRRVCFIIVDLLPHCFQKSDVSKMIKAIRHLNEIVAAVPERGLIHLSERRLLQIIFTYLSVDIFKIGCDVHINGTVIFFLPF